MRPPRCLETSGVNEPLVRHNVLAEQTSTAPLPRRKTCCFPAVMYGIIVFQYYITTLRIKYYCHMVLQWEQVAVNYIAA